ncbi:MAG: hypothetical protein AUJ12_08815 [Alphaproteobacteria bacterium CG1_02_46_17]|nr:MAG: hypothetical protein AUJ12_08815 [Alphaproteobacteria bacterium CG1_02_46_17]
MQRRVKQKLRQKSFIFKALNTGRKENGTKGDICIGLLICNAENGDVMSLEKFIPYVHGITKG